MQSVDFSGLVHSSSWTFPKVDRAKNLGDLVEGHPLPIDDDSLQTANERCFEDC